MRFRRLIDKRARLERVILCLDVNNNNQVADVYNEISDRLLMDQAICWGYVWLMCICVWIYITIMKIDTTPGWGKINSISMRALAKGMRLIWKCSGGISGYGHKSRTSTIGDSGIATHSSVIMFTNDEADTDAFG